MGISYKLENFEGPLDLLLHLIEKNKVSIYIYVVITIIGCVLACSSIVPNDYLKLVVVMGALGVGLYGIMKGLSTPSTTEETASPEK